MNESLREVRLYGELGRRFGRVFRLAVATPAEAARALCAVLPGFRAAFLGPDGRQNYHVFVGRGARRAVIGEAQKDDLVGRDEPIRFVPEIQGAKRAGVGQIIAAVALYYVAAVLAVAGFPQAGAFVAQTAFAMLVGGVIQMLSPQRKPQDPANNAPSYGMDAGALNETNAGGPVPLAFGRLIIGSVQISAGLSTDQLMTVGGAPIVTPNRPDYMPGNPFQDVP